MQFASINNTQSVWANAYSGSEIRDNTWQNHLMNCAPARTTTQSDQSLHCAHEEPKVLSPYPYLTHSEYSCDCLIPRLIWVVAGHSIRCVGFVMHGLIWALPRENLILLPATNKGADQPAHLRSLISAFEICSLKSVIANYVSCKISIFQQAGWIKCCLVTNSKTGFLRSPHSAVFFRTFSNWKGGCHCWGFELSPDDPNMKIY